MSNARPKEGPRAPLFYYPFLLLVWALPAASQTVALSDLETCAALSTDELKLACFEAIVATSKRGETAPAETGPDVVPASAESMPESEPGPVDVPAAPEAADVAKASAAGVPATSGSTPKAAPEIAVTAAAEQAPRQTAAAPPPPEPARSSVATFGSEHLQEDEPEEPRVLNATVVEVSKTGRGALVFYLDNGQVWRQIEPRYYPYPRDGEFDVTISTGMLGEYRLQVEGAGRRVTIRRVK